MSRRAARWTSVFLFPFIFMFCMWSRWFDVIPPDIFPYAPHTHPTEPLVLTSVLSWIFGMTYYVGATIVLIRSIRRGQL